MIHTKQTRDAMTDQISAIFSKQRKEEAGIETGQTEDVYGIYLASKKGFTTEEMASVLEIAKEHELKHWYMHKDEECIYLDIQNDVYISDLKPFI